MKNALLVFPRMKLRPFGEQTYLAHLFRALTDADSEYKFSTFAVGLKGKEEHYQRLAQIDTEKKGKHRWNPFPQTVFESLIANNIPTFDDTLFSNADIVHSFNAQLVPKTTKNFILTIHDLSNLRFLAGDDTEERNAHIRKALAFLTAKAQKIIAISHFSKDEIIELLGVDSGKIAVIHNGVDTEHFKPVALEDAQNIQTFLQRLKVQHPYLLHIGGASPRKNLLNLIKSFSMIREKHPEKLNLVIGGLTNPPPDIKSALDDCAYRSDIITPGYLSNQELLWLMQSAKALVFPSLYEGFGMPPLEAMACGVPVILSKLSSLPEVGGDAAAYCESAEAESIAEATTGLLSNPAQLEQNISRGLDRARKMSWHANALSTLALYSAIR